MPSADNFDFSQIRGFEEALQKAPETLLRELAVAFKAIGVYDIGTLRGSLAKHFQKQFKGLDHAFRSAATDPDRATGFDKIFADEFTSWKAAEIFQTGGTITAKDGGNLTILFAGARDSNGQRIYTRQRLQALIMQRKARFIPTPRGIMIVISKGGLTKTGATRKDSRDDVVGMLKKSVTEEKRLDFFENAERNDSIHEEILQQAVERALATIVEVE